ncbi:hypothetical protein [Exiguobacterium sp. CinTr1]|uniref:hypothetical protein n=1 Tax=Exiguobacterium sp. CinTr1 TaxID=2995315 RepID=UPI0022E6F51D|nr:hypothetical protein [Exiguobacterium sp. CinTr1]
MDDLTTESGLCAFLFANKQKVERSLRKFSRDSQMIECAVDDSIDAVLRKRARGGLELVPDKVLGYLAKCAKRRLRADAKANAKALMQSTDDLDAAVDGRQTIARLTICSEPTVPGADAVFEQKEDGQAAAKQLSAILSYASNDVEVTAILTAITEVIRANESKSDMIKSLNMSEVARQSNLILGYDRFTYKTVQTRLAKFSRQASRYLLETAA